MNKNTFYVNSDIILMVVNQTYLVVNQVYVKKLFRRLF